MASDIRASAWLIEKRDHPDFGRWRGFVMRRPRVGAAFRVVWSADETHSTQEAATACAAAQLPDCERAAYVH